MNAPATFSTHEGGAVLKGTGAPRVEERKAEETKKNANDAAESIKAQHNAQLQKPYAAPAEVKDVTLPPEVKLILDQLMTAAVLQLWQTIGEAALASVIRQTEYLAKTAREETEKERQQEEQKKAEEVRLKTEEQEPEVLLPVYVEKLAANPALILPLAFGSDAVKTQDLNNVSVDVHGAAPKNAKLPSGVTNGNVRSPQSFGVREKDSTTAEKSAASGYWTELVNAQRAQQGLAGKKQASSPEEEMRTLVNAALSDQDTKKWIEQATGYANNQSAGAPKETPKTVDEAKNFSFVAYLESQRRATVAVR